MCESKYYFKKKIERWFEFLLNSSTVRSKPKGTECNWKLSLSGVSGL